ncbi:MAG TPA: rhodanese-like domain-containing protein [Pyrinomonadaceae bacterium]|nr:rhodanese-like domain-containing protein [Pyrinomonadaceae bacterium]
MSLNKVATGVFMALVFCLPIQVGEANAVRDPTKIQGPQLQPHAIELITAEELKAKLTKNEPVAIIDVRASSEFSNSENRIKGAIHVKLRKLRYRLGMRPLSNLPHDREIVTYCACPSDESSMRAAQVLAAAGFSHVRVLKGGWNEWLKVNGPVDSKPKAL